MPQPPPQSLNLTTFCWGFDPAVFSQMFWGCVLSPVTTSGQNLLSVLSSVMHAVSSREIKSLRVHTLQKRVTSALLLLIMSHLGVFVILKGQHCGHSSFGSEGPFFARLDAAVWWKLRSTLIQHNVRHKLYVWAEQLTPDDMTDTWQEQPPPTTAVTCPITINPEVSTVLLRKQVKF